MSLEGVGPLLPIILWDTTLGTIWFIWALFSNIGTKKNMEGHAHYLCIFLRATYVFFLTIMNFHIFTYLQHKGLSLLSDILNSIECSILISHILHGFVHIGHILPYFYFIQNQILRFCSFSIQKYSTLCSFSAFLESLSQISLYWAGFNVGTKHSVFCFGIESLLYNAQYFGDLINTQGHCLQVNSDTPTPDPRPRSISWARTYSSFPGSSPLSKHHMWNSSELYPRPSSSLLSP